MAERDDAEEPLEGEESESESDEETEEAPDSEAALDDDESDDDDDDDDDNESDDDDDDDDDESDDDDDDDDESDDDDDDDDDDESDDDDDDDDDDESDDDDDDDDDESDDDDASDDDERAQEVARALGVGDDEDDDGESDGEDDDDDASQPRNRAERRRQRALRRRKRRLKADGDVEPRDRNKRKRDEMLAQRRKAAEAEDEDDDALAQLTSTEMMEDALARGTNAFVAWGRRNWKVLQWVITVAFVGLVAGLVFKYRTDETSSDAADDLAHAVAAHQAVVLKAEDDKRDESAKKRAYPLIFPTEEQKRQAALDGYARVTSDHPDTGAAILAKLGEAVILLDKSDWDAAIASFQAVIGSTLAKADVDVHLRALEGLGFAQEGKGDLDAALGTFAQLTSVDAGPMAGILAQYHQARVHAAKGETDKAKELLLAAKKEAEAAKLGKGAGITSHPYRWVEQAITEALKDIDPSLVPTKPPPSAGGGLSPEKLQQMLRERGLNPATP